MIGEVGAQLPNRRGVAVRLVSAACVCDQHPELVGGHGRIELHFAVASGVGADHHAGDGFGHRESKSLEPFVAEAGAFGELGDGLARLRDFCGAGIDLPA